MTILTFLCLYFYRATTEDVDYLENQCADTGSLGMCEYQEYPGQDLGFPDLQITARNKGEVTLQSQYLKKVLTQPLSIL